MTEKKILEKRLSNHELIPENYNTFQLKNERILIFQSLCLEDFDGIGKTKKKMFYRKLRYYSKGDEFGRLVV